jgi:FixJ family two-component response regulator
VPIRGLSRTRTRANAAAADRDYLRRVLGELGDVERVIVELTDQGFSQEEIGEVLGISARAVERRLYRLRRKDVRSCFVISRHDRQWLSKACWNLGATVATRLTGRAEPITYIPT